jgi:hypothetical protein
MILKVNKTFREMNRELHGCHWEGMDALIERAFFELKRV